MRNALTIIVLATLVASSSVRADSPFDHGSTRFPLIGKHSTVACESCHPPAGTGRQWKGVSLDCHGCHGDRKNHKGALGTACAACHDASRWTSIRHTAAQHRFPLAGTHRLDCAACHAGGKHLVREISGCAECHQPPHPGTTAACDTCHAVTGWRTVAFRHAQDPGTLGGKHRDATCLGCHPGFRFAHTTRECESCHRSEAPHESVGVCSTCHSALAWSTVTLAHDATLPPPTRYAVAATFDHVAHGRTAIARGSGATCAPCHAGSDPAHLRARPTMQACESCHDGTRAFAALGTKCGRCHREPAGAARPALPTAGAPFRHETHGALGVTIGECTTCHGVGVASPASHPGRGDHQPCIQCHAREFRTPGSALCLGCHTGNEPFAPLAVQPEPSPGPEWRSAVFPHEPHVAARVACADCHPDQAGGESRTRPGHGMCGACHGVGSGLPLELARCAGCHALASSVAEAVPRPWSTQAKFRHDADHRTESCDVCHRSDDTPALTPLTMRGCERCHDGVRAFKATGFACARCHTKA